MAQCLSNIITSHPLLYQKHTATSKTKWPLSSNGLKNGKHSIRASVNKDSLDHLQRANNYKPQQQEQFKKRTPQVTPIGLWDRFPTARTVQQMMDTMDRIMNVPLAYSNGNVGSWPSQLTSESGRYNRGRTPWDIKEREVEYKMRFDMPGMTKQDVKVWVEEKMLVVKAEKQTKTSDEEEKSSEKEEDWPEESFGKYSFRIVLPENIQYENIRAEVKDGVLYINIPKASVSSKILDINVE